MKINVKKSDGKVKTLKLGFGQKLNISVINFEHYYVIAADGWKKALAYLIKLLLLFSVILTCFVSYKTSLILSSVCDYAKNELPDFGIKDNAFWIDYNEPIILENGSSGKIILDANNPVTTYTNDNKNSNKDLIVISKDTIFFRNFYAGEMSYNIQNIGRILETSEFTKQDFINVLSDSKLYITITIYIFIAIFIMYFISMLIDVLALSVVGYMASRIVGLPLKYSATFAMATSAMSLPIILTLIYFIANILFDFYMSYFQVMITVVSYIYMISALLIMRSNLLRGDDNGEGNIKKRPLREKDDDGEKVDEE